MSRDGSPPSESDERVKAQTFGAHPGMPPSGGGSGAPTTAEYLVGAADATLTAERVVTDTASVTWDLATAGQAKAKRAALTGDVTAAADSNATTIPAGTVSLAKLANLATDTVIGRTTAGAGVPEAVPFGDPAQGIGGLTTPTRGPHGWAPGYSRTSAMAWQGAGRALPAKRWNWYFENAGVGYGEGTANPTAAGSVDGTDATGPARQLSSAVAGSVGSLRGAQNHQARWSPYGAALVRAGASAADLRGWCVSQNATTTPNSDTPSTHTAGLRYSSAIGPNWQLVTYNGVVNAVDAGIAYVAGSLYLCEWWTDDAGVTWQARVTDLTAATVGAIVSTTLNVPTATLDLRHMVWHCPIVSASKTLTVYGLEGECLPFWSAT